ncbi:alpha/beta fold hydrolase [Microbacterium oleivorans]|uniref:Alpha/beta hydrolase n=1 Tax=Microbacterium oleivorans TaxID=273677 RepID=A0A4R5YDY3_9MICO|nr:alpha/beta hydrolase [Microbacterium oleivorans]TDL43282.1 alpha/beta hydrolase [Microbacterium oleivorans]
MDIILIPGLWLAADSWDDVVPALRDAGHTPHPLTLPGVGAPESDIGLADWVDAVIAEIDRVDGPVVLVGHSGGGNVAWAAAEQRADRVRRVVLVDTTPPPPGAEISEFPIVDGVIPFPGWDFFDPEDTADLDEQTRARTAPLTASVPRRVPTDAVVMEGTERHRVPVTMLMGSMDDETFRRVVPAWGDFAAEFAAIKDAEIVRLGTGHWPQFSAPAELSRRIVEAVR